MTGDDGLDLEAVLDRIGRRRTAEQERRDDRREWALAGLGALAAVGLGFLFLYLLTTYPDAIRAFVHDLIGASS